MRLGVFVLRRGVGLGLIVLSTGEGLTSIVLSAGGGLEISALSVLPFCGKAADNLALTLTMSGREAAAGNSKS